MVAWLSVVALVVVGGGITLFLLMLMAMSLSDPSEGLLVKLGGHLGLLGLVVSLVGGVVVASLIAADLRPPGYLGGGWEIWLGGVLASHVVLFLWMAVVALFRRITARR